MNTIYVSPSHVNGDHAIIIGSEQHHLRNVLRLQRGDKIRIIDGKGSVYIAEIQNISTESTEVNILSSEFHVQHKPSVILIQALPKTQKMELILQKVTELGVTQVVPMITTRSLQRPSQNRLQRWNRVIISATKQCKRTWLPQLCDVKQFQECVNSISEYGRNLIFWEHERQQHIQSIIRDVQIESLAIWVGPEGGFTEEEIEITIESGCTPVTIGSNILRTETAAIAGLAIAAYEYKL